MLNFDEALDKVTLVPKDPADWDRYVASQSEFAPDIQSNPAVEAILESLMAYFDALAEESDLEAEDAVNMAFTTGLVLGVNVGVQMERTEIE